MPLPLRALRCLGLALTLTLSGSGAAPGLSIELRAADVVVGTLSTEGPNLAAVGGSVGGVNFWATRALHPGNGRVEESDLRWLQRVTFSKAVEGFPSPNRAFIDPRTGQGIGGGVSGDAEPWYDVSGPSRNTLSLRGGGDDAWVGDGPAAPLALAPLAFTAETLVVAIDALSRRALVLGGVRWGFVIGPTGATAVAAEVLADGPDLRADFDAALALDFPGWRLVPEPGGAALVAIGLAILGALSAPRESTRGSRSPRV